MNFALLVIFTFHKMYIGEFSITIGEKNRLALPKKLREVIDSQLIMSRGYERCLILVDKKRWEVFISEINKNPLFSLNVRDTKRFILGGAVEIETDSQGRFILPEALKEFSEIKEKVTFIGVGEWIEVWSEERWRERLFELSGRVSDLAERLK